MGKQTECDKLQDNNIVVNDIDVGLSMTYTTYRQTEIEKGGMKVIIECPEYSEKDNKVNEEVRELLYTALQEHLKKIS